MKVTTSKSVIAAATGMDGTESLESITRAKIRLGQTVHTHTTGAFVNAIEEDAMTDLCHTCGQPLSGAVDRGQQEHQRIMQRVCGGRNERAGEV